MLSKDTALEAEKIQISVLKKIGAEGRYKMTVELSDNIRDITLAGIRERHPDFSNEEVRRTLIKLLHGRDVYKQFFPDDKP